MSETYTKLLSSITDSSVWFEDDKTLRVWIAMLAMVDQHSYVWASVIGLAHRACVTVEQCEAALQKFESPDPNSRSKEYEGRRIQTVERGWLLLNHQRFKAMRNDDEKRRRDRERKRAERAAAKEPERFPEPPTDHDGSSTETVIPMDLSDRAEKILPELLSGMTGVTIEQLRDGVREFVGYWTIGGGKFKKRNFWMKRLRENLRQKYEQNKFRPPGAIEHDEHKPKPAKMRSETEELIRMAKEEEAKSRRRKAAAE